MVIPSSKSLNLPFLQETRARPCPSRPKLLRGPAPATRSSSTSITRQGGKLITRSSVKPSKRWRWIEATKTKWCVYVNIYIYTGSGVYRKTIYDYNMICYIYIYTGFWGPFPGPIACPPSKALLGWWVYPLLYGCFPRIGVPPNHPFLIGFSVINHPFWVPLFLETPIWKQWELSLDPTYLHGSFNGHGSFHIHLAIAPLAGLVVVSLREDFCFNCLGGGRHLFNSERKYFLHWGRIYLIEVIF